MGYIKKSVIFDIEQSYFLLNKIKVILAKCLFTRDYHSLFYFNQQNLIAI
jgi:hypothetical protein